MFTGKLKLHFSKILSYVGPVIEQRMRDLARRAKDPNFRLEEPNDLLQWIIQRAYQFEDSKEHATDLICKRFAITCFAAIHTTGLTSTNVLFDLLSSDPKQGVLEKIRAEITQIQLLEGPRWTKASIAKLFNLDSAIRESMRLHSVGSWGLQRMVVGKNVVFPDGMRVPYGVDLVLPGYFVQRDGDIYKDADQFVPFRFSKYGKALDETQSGPGRHDAKDRLSNILGIRNLAAVSTSTNHFSFGHGRHACPGRFFAIQEVKLMLAHLLFNYEMRPLESRPENPWIRDLMTPNTKATIWVRKMKLTMDG